MIVANADPWTFVGNRPLHPTPGVNFNSGMAMYARRRMGTVGMLLSMARMSGPTGRVGARGAYVRRDLAGLSFGPTRRCRCRSTATSWTPGKS